MLIKPILELHPAGIIIPRINSVSDAEKVVSSCRYPPRGNRGFGPARGLRFGAIPATEYLASADEQMLVIPQIEHINAVDKIDEILDIEGIDKHLAAFTELLLTAFRFLSLGKNINVPPCELGG